MTNAEIYLRAAERIDSGESYHIWNEAFWAVFNDDFSDFDRETRVLALCFMSAMEDAK